jgi:pimeloyl-ACP methyl ester carboxylesterase
MMARVWRNYFDPPEQAPAPSDAWLAGIHSVPICATRRAAIDADGALLRGDRLSHSTQVLIIFGESDIYGDTKQRLLVRYPSARAVMIPGAGHVPWLQNRARFAEEVLAFFATDARVGTGAEP